MDMIQEKVTTYYSRSALNMPYMSKKIHMQSTLFATIDTQHTNEIIAFDVSRLS